MWRPRHNGLVIRTWTRALGVTYHFERDGVSFQSISKTLPALSTNLVIFSLENISRVMPLIWIQKLKIHKCLNRGEEAFRIEEKRGKRLPTKGKVEREALNYERREPWLSLFS
ncbi:hypothetical protein CRG98_018709 [Punica granatum]|uniref:Uncharacterized protein n=1 Tax=Punica granatum TaxID=22663 RepID=A0A2I0JX52_PUNGR|nr:hypothetical protein CRG98_018709 [Punica granatum]